MIGCDGPTMTVRLFSKRPWQEIERVWVDADSHTSGALLGVLVAMASGRAPELIEFDVDARRAEREAEREAGREPEWPDALLVIGDKVVTDSPPAVHYPHQLDLGEAWKEATGLPFVYAVWMCRAERADSLAVRAAASILDRQRRHNATRLDWIVASRSGVRGWPDDLARRYLTELLRYEVGPREREAVDRYFDEAARFGLIGERRPSRWPGV